MRGMRVGVRVMAMCVPMPVLGRTMVVRVVVRFVSGVHEDVIL